MSGRGSGYREGVPRSLWNGTILVAAIGVPVKLYSATQSQTVSFREVHLADGSAIEHRRYCSAEEEQVPYAEVVKGFEIAEGEYVVLEKDEIVAAAGGRTRFVDVEDFVDAAAIDPVHYEKSYYLGPGKDGDEAYALLRRKAMHDQKQVVEIAQSVITAAELLK